MRGPLFKDGPWCGGTEDHCDRRATTRLLIALKRRGGQPWQLVRNWPLCRDCADYTSRLHSSDPEYVRAEVPLDWRGNVQDLMSVQEVMVL